MSEAAAIARKAGRKRLDGLRSPIGRLSRKVTDVIEGYDSATVMRLVSSALRGHSRPEYGSPLGRLFLAGKITAPEFEAGRRWGRLIQAYHRATDAPMPDPKSIVIGTAPGRSPHADPDSEAGLEKAKQDRAIINACHEAHAIIISHGRRAESEVRALCEGLGEYPAGHEAFLRVKGVLAGLANFWDLTTPSSLRHK